MGGFGEDGKISETKGSSRYSFLAPHALTFVTDGARSQPLHLGLVRSDYMLHTGEENGKVSLKQVEINTESCGGGGLSERVSAMHRQVTASQTKVLLLTHSVILDTSVLLLVTMPSHLTPNLKTTPPTKLLVEAHNAYGVPR